MYFLAFEVSSKLAKPRGARMLRQPNKDYGCMYFCLYVGLKKTGAPNDNFRKNICSEDNLRSRIFGIFVVKFLTCLPLLGFSDI